jgi:hypothetical protein
MPADPIPPTSSTARRGFAPTWPPTWTACPSVSWPSCWGSCPAAASSRWGLGVLIVALNERLQVQAGVLKGLKACPTKGLRG